jgi:hypothetical protein
MKRGCHHCDEFSRLSLLRRGAAEAGRGLPAIEPGMPLPAGTGLDRRSFVSGAFGLALSVYGLGKLKLFEEGIAQAASPPARPVLVSIFLPGGVDSLSVLYPALDPDYRKLRPKLALPESAGPVFAEDTRLHWHPSLKPLTTLHAEGKVSVLPAVGYTHPDQSHFTSRHFWEVGATDARLTTAGWAATSTARAQGTTRCRGSRSTTSSSRRWPPRRCRWRRWPRPTSTRWGRRGSGARSRTGCCKRLRRSARTARISG